jgi:hypothetical protein
MKLILILGTIGLLAACGAPDSSAPLQIDPLVGSYVLQTVGGRTLPAVSSQTGTYTRSITAGTMVLEVNDAFDLTYTERISNNGVVSTEVIRWSGTWWRSSSDGAYLQFKLLDLPGVDTQLGTTSPAGITMTGLIFTENGGAFFYAKSH